MLQMLKKNDASNDNAMCTLIKWVPIALSLGAYFFYKQFVNNNGGDSVVNCADFSKLD